MEEFLFVNAGDPPVNTHLIDSVTVREDARGGAVRSKNLREEVGSRSTMARRLTQSNSGTTTTELSLQVGG